MKRRRILSLLLVYLLLLAGGWALAMALPALAESRLMAGAEAGRAAMLVMVGAVYVVASALPFVPGAEIGFGLMAAFGARLAGAVYLCMLLALCLAYGVGRLVPPAALAALFARAGLRRAAALVQRGAGLDPEARGALLAEALPTRALPWLVRHRHVALAVALNLPGNSLAGGGGGLALMAGLSRLFPAPAFLLTVALACAPAPLLVWLTGWGL